MSERDKYKSSDLWLVTLSVLSQRTVRQRNSAPGTVCQYVVWPHRIFVTDIYRRDEYIIRYMYDILCNEALYN